MPEVIDLCEGDSDDNGGEWPNIASVPSLPLSAWEDRLSELADYHKIHGHCNVTKYCSGENTKLGEWVATQRTHYRLHLEGKISQITLPRIQALESLGFEWVIYVTTWEDRLSELADYRKIHGHCNIPQRHSENAKLGRWVNTQRYEYRLHLEGKASHMTLPRFQALESLGFEWDRSSATVWERNVKRAQIGIDHTQAADHREFNDGIAASHPMNSDSDQTSRDDGSTEYYSQKLSTSKPPSNASGRHWSVSAWEDRLSELAEYRKIHGDCNVPQRNSEYTKLANWVKYQRRQYKVHLEGKKSTMTTFRIQELKSLGFYWGVYTTALENRLSKLAAYSIIQGNCKVPRNYSENSKLAEFDDTDLEGLPSELAAKPSLYIDKQAAKSLSLDKSAPAGDEQTAKSPSSDKSASVGKESQLELAPSNEMLRTNPVLAEPLQQKLNVFNHALLLEGEPAGNGVQATPDKPANAPHDMQQTFQDEAFRSDNVLNEVELELVWLGEESMYCLSCPAFQFDFIYEYASPALTVELRKLSRDDKSEVEKLKQLVRMEEWLVSRRFDFVRTSIRMMLGRGFRRQRMGIVIAELRLLRRQHSKRHFPAMILDRS
jgi:hypothetical protein